MSKHTPGPWFYDSGAIWSDSQLDPENKPYVFRGEEPLAAVISRNAQDSHLIAAAPDMLEALRELLGDFGCIVTAANHNDLATIVCVAKACQGEINELLRKVEGEK